jgi:uncharacterized membrane protein YgaE (UPF0421/DUF939 family)
VHVALAVFVGVALFGFLRNPAASFAGITRTLTLFDSDMDHLVIAANRLLFGARTRLARHSAFFPKAAL